MRMRLFCLSLILAATAGAAQSGRSLALVAELAGRATWADGRALDLLDEIPANQAIRLEAGARLEVVQLGSGDALVFHGPGRVRFTAAGGASGLKPVAVTRHRLPSAFRLKPGGLAQISMAMREAGAGRRLAVLPLGPVLLGPRPEFRWEAVSPSASYRLRLVDGQGQPWLEQTQAETAFQVPEAKALQAEASYRWTLAVLLPGQTDRVVAEGQLRLLPGELQAALLPFKLAGPAFQDRLLYALLAENLELRDEARPLWRELARQRPGSARLRVLAAR